ncbi:MAG TPA: hypothetical protein ENN46_04340 [Candidatus Woesearchaeota archaeon]|mgnify:CR=1 FL=1|nr:hypothetical protein [Candidatus Woesearchaeota archaeon]
MRFIDTKINGFINVNELEDIIENAASQLGLECQIIRRFNDNGSYRATDIEVTQCDKKNKYEPIVNVYGLMEGHRTNSLVIEKMGNKKRVKAFIETLNESLSKYLSENL